MAPLFSAVPKVTWDSCSSVFHRNKPIWLLQMRRECLEMSMTLCSNISGGVFNWGFSVPANPETKFEPLWIHMMWASTGRILRNQKYADRISVVWNVGGGAVSGTGLQKTGYIVPQWLNTDPAQSFLPLGETVAVGQGIKSVSNCIFYKLVYPDHAAQSQNAGGY